MPELGGTLGQFLTPQVNIPDMNLTADLGGVMQSVLNNWTSNEISGAISKFSTSNPGIFVLGLKDKANAFKNSKTVGLWKSIGSGVDSAMSAVADLFIDRSDQNKVGQTVGAVRDKAASMLMKSGNPFMMAAGAAVKITDATGGFTDASLGLGAADVGNVASAFLLPGAGWFTPKTDTFKVSDKVRNSSGYAGTVKGFEKAENNQGKKLLFGRGKANKMIREAKDTLNKITDTLTFNEDMLASQASNAADISLLNMFNQMGGWSAGGVQFGAEGLKLKDRNKVRELAEKARKRRLEEVASFKKGGKIGDQSVIPGGALHARKHQLGEYNENLAGQVTHKGVPVVSFEFGGEVEQHAEIERGEIIFRKEITDKLEELWRDRSEEAALEAGKLITEEIINNTIDNSGEYEIENKEQDIYS